MDSLVIALMAAAALWIFAATGSAYFDARGQIAHTTSEEVR